jgi:uncharacterized membrane protein YkvA (DUF1232 family)
MEETKLSPEALGKRLGISNMTVRRWTKGPAGRALPAIYAKAVEDTVYQLMIDGVLDADSRSARWVLGRSQNLSFRAAIKNLGLSDDFKTVLPGQDDRFMLVLSKIGSHAGRQAEVDSSGERMKWFKRLGESWSERIGVMQRTLASKKVSPVDKLVAYGALFYLICPFDLIPDNIPVFGLVDDYAVLGLAMAYLLKKYADLRPGRPAA